jgi:hypothetical protein
MKKIMVCLTLSPALLSACAAAPLYTSSGLQRGAATVGEIPRDERGEPVWAAIPTMPRQERADASANGRAGTPEGDAEVQSIPPKA